MKHLSLPRDNGKQACASTRSSKNAVTLLSCVPGMYPGPVSSLPRPGEIQNSTRQRRNPIQETANLVQTVQARWFLGARFLVAIRRLRIVAKLRLPLTLSRVGIPTGSSAYSLRLVLYQRWTFGVRRTRLGTRVGSYFGTNAPATVTWLLECTRVAVTCHWQHVLVKARGEALELERAQRAFPTRRMQ